MAKGNDQTTTENERAAGVRKAYGMATAWLRDENPERFKELQAKAAKDLGIEWKPRLSKEEREEQELNELLARRPDLREKLLAPAGGQPLTPEDPTGGVNPAPDTVVEKGL